MQPPPYPYHKVYPRRMRRRNYDRYDDYHDLHDYLKSNSHDEIEPFSFYGKENPMPSSRRLFGTNRTKLFDQEYEMRIPHTVNINFVQPNTPSKQAVPENKKKADKAAEKTVDKPVETPDEKPADTANAAAEAPAA